MLFLPLSPRARRFSKGFQQFQNYLGVPLTKNCAGDPHLPDQQDEEEPRQITPPQEASPPARANVPYARQPWCHNVAASYVLNHQAQRRVLPLNPHPFVDQPFPKREEADLELAYWVQHPTRWRLRIGLRLNRLRLRMGGLAHLGKSKLGPMHGCNNHLCTKP